MGDALMRRLRDLPRPFIVCVLTDRTGAETVATMRQAYYEGAEAYELNLPALGDLEDEGMKRIFNAVDRPVYTSCRRAAFMGVYGMTRDTLPDWDDEERMARQLASLKLGSAGIDIELDTFDPQPAPPPGTPEAEQFAVTSGQPAELTHDPAAVSRQKATIQAAHETGSEVILSCHTGRPQSTRSLIEIVETAVGRGADLVKVVSPCPTIEDLFGLLAAITRLHERVSKPFILVGAGENGSLSRTIGINLGAGWMLAQQTFQPGGFHPQPLVSHAREIRRLIPWRYTGGV
jgi:hypothetical protein